MRLSEIILGQSCRCRANVVMSSAPLDSARGLRAWRIGSPPKLYSLTIVLTFVAGAGAFRWAGHPGLGAGALTIGFLIVVLLILQTLMTRAARMAELMRFEGDYAVMLTALASSLKGGRDPITALTEQADIFGRGSCIGLELSKFSEDLRLGRPESEAVLKFCGDIQHPDIDLFRFSFLLGKAQGGSLSACLHRLARVTRQRQAFRRKAGAATAMQRLSAIGIGACAVVISLIQFSSSPEAFWSAWSDPVGQKLLFAGYCLAGSGIFWMFSLTRARI